MSQEQAISNLKKVKELLDQEIITQEEYEKVKAELMPYLIKKETNIKEKCNSFPNSEAISVHEKTKEQELQLTPEEVADEMLNIAIKSNNTSSNNNIPRSIFILLGVVGVILFVGIAGAVLKSVNNQKSYNSTSSSVSSYKSTTNRTSANTTSDNKSTPYVAPATDAEIADAWAKWLKLYDELQSFKKKSDFHFYGISSASPYYDWSRRVDDLGKTKAGIELTYVYEVNCIDLTQIAMHYISSKGKDNDYTMYIAGIVNRKRQKH